MLKRATNIAELVPPLAKGKAQYSDTVISQIHKQMPTKFGKWPKELERLRFIVDDAESAHHDDSPSEAAKSVPELIKTFAEKEEKCFGIERQAR